MKHVILAPALTELEEAVCWYNLQYSGLGDAFKKAVQTTLHRIILHPYLASEIESGYYRQFITTFPYKIIYRIHSDTLIVLAIAHNHRSPKYWAKR